jgi:hypothetical protein
LGFWQADRNNEGHTMQTTTYTIYIYYLDHDKAERQYKITSDSDCDCEAAVLAFAKSALNSGDRGTFVTRRGRPWLKADRAEDGSLSFKDITPHQQVADACRILRQRFGEQAENILHMEVPLEESVSKFAADLNNSNLDAHELVAEYLAENAEFKAT